MFAIPCRSPFFGNRQVMDFSNFLGGLNAYPHAMMAIAVEGHVSLPTARKIYAQLPVQQSLYERVRDAVEKLGYSKFYPIPPRVRSQPSPHDGSLHADATGPPKPATSL